MDPDFKPQTQNTNNDAVPVTVGVKPQAVSTAPTVSPSPSVADQTPSDTASSDFSFQPTEKPSPVIQAAAVEMDAHASQQKEDLSAAQNVKRARKSGKNGKRLLISLFTLVLMIASAAGGYLGHDSIKSLLGKDDTTKTTTTTKKVVAPAKVLTAIDVIAKIKGSTTLLTASKLDMISFSPEKVNGYTYYVAPVASDATSLSYTPTTADFAGAYTKMKASLLSYGLKAEKEVAATSSLPASGTFADQNVRCFVGPFTANLSIGCINKTDYAATATKLKPFVDLYASSATTDKTLVNSGNFVVTDAPITASKTAGYATTGISVGTYNGAGGSVALFYQTPDQQWHYFKNTQQALMCTDYNTSDLKKAYVDTACFTGSGSTQATVKI